MRAGALSCRMSGGVFTGRLENFKNIQEFWEVVTGRHDGDAYGRKWGI
jgi:hypothetical protein